MQGIMTVALLIISNIFMTIAWYGHLRFRATPLWEVILISWLIASLEYCFQVPANRIGSFVFSAAQLKIIQEVITLIVFSIFSVVYLKQPFQWNYLVAFALIVGAVFFVFMSGNTPHAEKAFGHSFQEVQEVKKIQDVQDDHAGKLLSMNSGAVQNVQYVEKIIDQATR